MHMPKISVVFSPKENCDPNSFHVPFSIIQVTYNEYVQFSSVQPLNRVRLFATP